MKVISCLENVENAEAFGIQMGIYDELLELLVGGFDRTQLDQLFHSVRDPDIDIDKFSFLFCTEEFLMFLN